MLKKENIHKNRPTSFNFLKGSGEITGDFFIRKIFLRKLHNMYSRSSESFLEIRSVTRNYNYFSSQSEKVAQIRPEASLHLFFRCSGLESSITERVLGSEGEVHPKQKLTRMENPISLAVAGGSSKYSTTPGNS